MRRNMVYRKICEQIEVFSFIGQFLVRRLTIAYAYKTNYNDEVK